VPQSITDSAVRKAGAEDVLAAILGTTAQPIWIVNPDGRGRETIHHRSPAGAAT
jgi:hypothetical protein